MSYYCENCGNFELYGTCGNCGWLPNYDYIDFDDFDENDWLNLFEQGNEQIEIDETRITAPAA